MKRIAMLLLAGAVNAAAYIPNPIDGPQYYRTDSTAIQFLANQNIAPGLTRADGVTVWITPDSDPMGAIKAAVATWNAVTTTSAHFLPIQTTTLSYAQDGNNVIVFADDPYTQTAAAGGLAFTIISYNTSNPGPIIDTDIIFSPVYQFSTTLATNTYDIQSIVTHELGHSLGSNHTNILSATMYYATAMQEIHKQSLADDDIAFVSNLYQGSTTNSYYGSIYGTATVNGTPLLGGPVAAIDPNTGITVGGFTSVKDGTFAFLAPPGNYFIYLEPAVNLVLYQSNPNADQSTIINTSFQSAFAGGNAQPTLVQVQSGVTSPITINAAAGVTPLTVPAAGIGTAGMTGDFHGGLVTGSISVSSGQAVDLVFSNPLGTAALAESNIQVLGPATLRPGSLRRDTIALTNGTPIYRFTLDIPPLAANALATLVFRSGSNILTRTGMLLLTRPQSVNAGSFLGGPVAPGEILSFFGPQLGPASPVSNGGFDANGFLPTTLAGITVSFGSTHAPLFYASNNQINMQVPYEISGQTSTLMTILYNGSTVATSTLNVAKAAPGIFVVTNANGSVNGPAAPASAGDILVIYGTGAGNPGGVVETGSASPAGSTVPASVTIAGIPVTPIFAGLTPGSVGLAQVNVAIPVGTPVGDAVPLQFSMGGAPTQVVNISVR